MFGTYKGRKDVDDADVFCIQAESVGCEPHAKHGRHQVRIVVRPSPVRLRSLPGSFQREGRKITKPCTGGFSDE